MKFLLRFARVIDKINGGLGQFLTWLVLAATLISAGNAVIRKLFGQSSNAFLEIQWYLFAAVFILGGGYAFLRNVHVRIDFVSARLTPKSRNIVDIVGIVLFLSPLCFLMIHEGWPVFVNAWSIDEVSSNAGGLIRWPVYLLIPVGFFLLLLQGFSELVKRVAFLMGLIDDPLSTDAT